MSLIQQERPEGLYMKISGGTISYTSTKDDPKAVAVKYEDSITKEEKTTYKVRVPSLLGRFVGAKYKKSNYGTNLELLIQNGIEVGILQIKVKSSLHNAIINLLMNVNVNRDVTISAWVYNDRTYVGFEQDGEKIKGRNSREKSEAPEAVKKEEFGEVKWDFTEVTQYYYNYIVNEFAKKLGELVPPVKEELSPEAVKAIQEEESPFGNKEAFQQTTAAPAGPPPTDVPPLPFEDDMSF